MKSFTPHSERKTMREQVELLLPNWQAWYPSLFDAACDLGLLRARVCDLSSLVLSNRHASVQNEALQAFRQQWSVDEPEELQDSPSQLAVKQPSRHPFKRPSRGR